eukprot:305165-Karenia_brevis.AAC.1
MDRLFPGMTPESHEQATLAAAVGGLGWRKASEVALPANLGALVMAAPKVRTMAAAAEKAGLLPVGSVDSLLQERTRQVEAAYMGRLDEFERVRAEVFLRQAREAADGQWRST